MPFVRIGRERLHGARHSRLFRIDKLHVGFRIRGGRLRARAGTFQPCDLPELLGGRFFQIRSARRCRFCRLGRHAVRALRYRRASCRRFPLQAGIGFPPRVVGRAIIVAPALRQAECRQKCKQIRPSHGTFFRGAAGIDDGAFHRRARQAGAIIGAPAGALDVQLRRFSFERRLRGPGKPPPGRPATR